MGIETTRHGDVVELTLDWPAVRNALGPAEGRALRLALDAATSDPANAVVVLSAAGDAFCAGGNLAEIVALSKGGEDAVRTTIYGEFQGVFRAIAQSPIPILTAVDGPAIGFGCDLALAGQATLIGQRGWIAQGWAKAGLIPATGGTLYVGRRGGPQAIWRLLAADRVDGPTAEAWGLAIACEHARDAALAMAARLAALPSAALRATVDLARITDEQAHLATALDHQTSLITDPSFATRASDLLRRRTR